MWFNKITQTIYNGAVTCFDFHISLSFLAILRFITFQCFQGFKGYQGFQYSEHWKLLHFYHTEWHLELIVFMLTTLFLLTLLHILAAPPNFLFWSLGHFSPLQYKLAVIMCYHWCWWDSFILFLFFGSLNILFTTPPFTWDTCIL